MLLDLRFALRTLRHSPAFTAVAIVSLALGIGANTAIFSLLYQVVYRSLPVKDPEHLVLLNSDDYKYGWTRSDNNKAVFSYPMYRELRDRGDIFSGLIGRSAFAATISYRGEARAATLEIVTGNFFNVLGTKPALGRLLQSPDDGALNQSSVVVLGYRFWTGSLAADPNIVGKTIYANGKPVTVVGVAPRGFRGLLSGNDPDCYATTSMLHALVPSWQKREVPSAYWLSLLGRLKPGVTEARARAQLEPLFHSVLTDELPQFKDISQSARTKLLAKKLWTEPAAQGLNVLRDQWETPLLVLAAMVGLVLLIACANVANLLIARAAARQREISVRLAIGASKWQVVRQLLVESLLLSFAGGLLGLVAADALTRGLLSILPPDTTGGWLAPQVNGRLFLFAFALSVITGLIFGSLPALQIRQTDFSPALKEQGGGTSAGIKQSKLRETLVVAQICLSLLLLVGAGLFGRTLFNLMNASLGFRSDHLITFFMRPGLAGYTPERENNFVRELGERLRGLPGVQSAAFAVSRPMASFGWGSGLRDPQSGDVDKQIDCKQNAIGPNYFQTVGTPLRQGREFSVRDSAKSAKVVVVNEALVRAAFPRGDALGRHIKTGADNLDLEIVGIAGNSNYQSIREKIAPMLYVPFEQADKVFIDQTTFLLRTSGDEKNVMRAVQQVAKQTDASIPLEGLDSMAVIIGNTVYTERLMAVLAAAFSVLAVLLAAIGLYGVIAYSVTRRTREFGIRLALGAERDNLLQLVMRQVAVLLIAGLVVGLLVSYGLARLVESQLYGIHAGDPLILGGAIILMLFVGLSAAVQPALSAMRIEPVQALRHE